MTATDELCRLLDERGVEWQKPLSIMEQYKTVWRNGPWEYTAVEISGGVFGIYAKHREWLAPEQVVEATLGSGTCHMEYCDEWSGDELYPTEAYVCSACRYVTVDGKPNYCPNCGAKAVDE